MPTSPTVLVLDAYAATYAARLKAEFPQAEIFAVARRDALPAELDRIDVLVAFGIMIDDALVARMTGLRWIQSLATGVDHFLRCPSLKKDTLLTSARGIHGPAMRETVLLLMLALSHQMPCLLRSQAAHRWDRGTPWPLLAGKTAVVLGTGVVGKAVGHTLQALDMRVIGLSRMPRAEAGFERIEALDTLREAAGHADYLINIMPGGPTNANLIDAAVFAAMKPGAFFVNVGRGETVDETAMIEALRTQRIAGAGLDVFAREPLPADSPLWDLPNVIIAPHIGGLFDEYENYVLPLIVENMRYFLAGDEAAMRNVIAH